MIKVTGLFKNTDKDGRIYLTGKINGSMQAKVFQNKFKKHENQHDYFLYFDEVKKKQPENEV